MMRLICPTYSLMRGCLTLLLCIGSLQQVSAQSTEKASPTHPTQVLAGTWLLDKDGTVMLDPQTSGLKFQNGFLYTLSDGSAHQSQIRRLHQIDVQQSRVVKKWGPTTFSEAVKQSCFYEYLNSRPDYEGLVAVPQQPDTWIWVTEDATRSKPLNTECALKYADTHSTQYPTLLVKLVQVEHELLVQAVRPVQFPEQAKVGNAPNDGIEGLSITQNNELLLGLEKDASGKARVFRIELDDLFWQQTEFAKVSDAQLLLPDTPQGNHPINGMDVYYPSKDSSGYLLAAARNDNQLWIIDLAGKHPAMVVPLLFLAPSVQKDDGNYCAPLHEMNNASIEGVAVVGHQLWMVNDPWKRNYAKNIVCEADRAHYQANSPLLFKLDLQSLALP